MRRFLQACKRQQRAWARQQPMFSKPQTISSDTTPSKAEHLPYKPWAARHSCKLPASEHTIIYTMPVLQAHGQPAGHIVHCLQAAKPGMRQGESGRPAQPSAATASAPAAGQRQHRQAAGPAAKPSAQPPLRGQPCMCCQHHMLHRQGRAKATTCCTPLIWRTDAGACGELEE